MIFLTNTQNPIELSSYGGIICDRETSKKVRNIVDTFNIDHQNCTTHAFNLNDSRYISVYIFQYFFLIWLFRLAAKRFHILWRFVIFGIDCMENHELKHTTHCRTFVLGVLFL